MVLMPWNDHMINEVRCVECDLFEQRIDMANE
jgi:Zn ribbon nucleic-acid-binding protein